MSEQTKNQERIARLQDMERRLAEQWDQATKGGDPFNHAVHTRAFAEEALKTAQAYAAVVSALDQLERN
tara:strand:+ start:641 stop:847 length:207 start_codon:yes stop_codon:yes gene_type:complete